MLNHKLNDLSFDLHVRSSINIDMGSGSAYCKSNVVCLILFNGLTCKLLDFSNVTRMKHIQNDGKVAAHGKDKRRRK